MARAFDLQEWLDTDLRHALDRLTRRRVPGLPAPQVAVRAPGARFRYGDDRPFHTASIGKNFVAVLVGRLVERGVCTLETPIGWLVNSVDLGALPSAAGIDVARDVTVGHLLAHRSGLPDPLFPPRGHDTDCSVRALVRTPDRTFALRDVVAAMSGLPATGRPGARFAYGDGNYALLLCAAEDATGRPFRELLREEVFGPAAMADTHQPPVPPGPDGGRPGQADRRIGGDIAPMVLRRVDVIRTPAMTSIGAVDGGAVTTLDDLLRFQTALHDGRLLGRELAARLMSPSSRLRPGIHYGTGFATLRFAEFGALGLRRTPAPMGGLGLTSTHAFRHPGLGADVVLNLHSDAAMRASFQVHLRIARALAAASR